MNASKDKKEAPKGII